MRILITSIVDLKRVTHNRIHVFAEYLSRRHDVTALCLNAWWLDSTERDGARTGYHEDPYFQELFDRTRIVYLSHGKRRAILQEFTSLRTLDPLLREIDLTSFDVHVNYSNLIAGYYVARKAEHRGIPTVLDIADDLPRRFAASPQVPLMLGGVARVLADVMLAANVKLASKVTLVTEALKNAYHLPEDRALVIPNGVNAKIAAHKPSDVLSKVLGIKESFVLGFVGVLLPRIDLDLMFTITKDVCSRLPNAKMLIVGGGDRLPEARGLAKAYGVSDKVIFTGLVPFGEVAQYVSCMDVCLVPITDGLDCQHAFPIKLVEYMACGKPVVSTLLAGVKEAVGDRVLYARDSSEFVSRITELYRDQGLRCRMGLEGRAFVVGKYDWEEICRTFEATLREATTEAAVAASSRSGWHGPQP